MANTLTTITTGLTTFGRVLLPELINQMVIARLVNRNYQGAGTMIGNVLEVPDLDISGNAAVRAIGGAAVASDLVSSKRSLTVQHIYQGFQVDNFEVLITSVPLMERASRRIAYNVARLCDATVLGLWNEIGTEVGTLDGTAAFLTTINPLADARKAMMNNQSIMSPLYAVICPSEAAALRKITNLYKVSEAGDNALLRSGVLGSLFGFEILESQNVANALTSVAAETATPGAIVGAHVIGATSISMNGLGAGSVKKGTTYSIVGVVNQTGNNVKFVVTADATITANAATVIAHPPLPVALAGAEVVNFIEHTVIASQNICFAPDAILAVARAPQPFVGGGVVSVTVTDEQTGLGIRLSYESQVQGSAGNAFVEKVTADLYFGAKVVRPEFACRITGLI